MRKFFTITIILLLLTITAKAQIIFSEDFETDSMPEGWTFIDADEDNINWLHSSDSLLGPGYGHNSDHCMFSQSYDFTLGALTPDNWLVTPAINLTDSCMLTFWICAQDADFATEHYGVYISTTIPSRTSAFTLLDEWTIGGTRGQSRWEQKAVDLSDYSGTVYLAFRHFNSTNQFYLNLDDIAVSTIPPAPTLFIDTTSLNFSNVAVGSSKTISFPITAFALSSDLTLSATNPFFVSTDNVTFGETATLAANPLLTTGTAYVRYSPTTVGTNSDQVSILTENAESLIINVFGNAIDCSIPETELPYTEDFESGEFPPRCWDIDVPDQNSTWESIREAGTSWASCYGDDEVQTKKLITQTFDFSNYQHSILLDFDFMSNYAFISEGFADFKIYASTDGGITYIEEPFWKLSEFGVFTNWMSTHASVNLSSLAGQSNVALAFVFEGRQVQVLFDNIHINYIEEPTISLSDEALSYSVAIGQSAIQRVDVNAYNLSEDITVTTNAPFSVSANGNTFLSSATIPADGGTLYVKYTAVEDAQTDSAILTSSGITQTISLSGNGVDCSSPLELPFFDDCENGISACWQNIDHDEDGYSWMDDTELNLSTHSGSRVYYSASYMLGAGALTPENWLITPTLAIPENGATLSYWVAAQAANFPEEHYDVFVSTSGTDFENFNSIFNETLASDNWENRILSLQPYAGQNIHIAFVHKDVTNLFLLKIDDISVTANNGIREMKDNVNIYPNPTQNTLHISTSSPIFRIEVFNTMGQKVAVYDATDTHTQINTSYLDNGIYLIRISTENGILNSKFTVTR